MNDLLGHLSFVKVYLDDIVIHDPDPDTHLDDLEEVLTILKENQVQINFEKTSFMKTSVNS